MVLDTRLNRCVWVEGRNMDIKREQNDFRISKREILCE